MFLLFLIKTTLVQVKGIVSDLATTQNKIIFVPTSAIYYKKNNKPQELPFTNKTAQVTTALQLTVKTQKKNCIKFLPRDAMLSTVHAVVVCLSVCVCLNVCHTPVVY